MLTVPTAGESDQLTPVLVVPLTEATNCADWPPLNDTLVGDSETVIAGGTREMVAVADLVPSAALTAVTVTVWADVMVAGAVYRPFTIVPVCGDRDHVTLVFVDPVTVAVNCCVWPSLRATDVGLTERATDSAGDDPGLRKTVLLVVTNLPLMVDAAVMVTARELLCRRT